MENWPHLEDSRKPEDIFIIVGMSGGVDSSVTAAILKEQGFKVAGLFMRNWNEQDENGVCQATEDYEDVKKVADQLEIPCYSIDLSKDYYDSVFEFFLKEYSAGRTPNPDILCNREIKFKTFFQHAMTLGADYLATGHYCRVGYGETGARLLKGVDPGKDQSYFLSAINPDVLPNVHFPLGHLLKTEVRDLAKKYQLATSEKKDSTGVCFIGERNFPKFLGNYLKGESGSFQTLDEKDVGTHMGHQFYTIGQRKGLGLGGPGEPWYVVGKDIDKNIVYVVRGSNHPALFINDLEVSDLHWINYVPTKEFSCTCKVRYRQGDQACTVKLDEKGKAKVVFAEPQRGVALSQQVAFYQGDCLVGSGVISKTGPTQDAQLNTLFQRSFGLEREAGLS